MKSAFIIACTLATSQATNLSVNQSSAIDRNIVGDSEHGHNRECAIYIDRLFNGSVDYNQIIADGQPWEDPQFPTNEALYNDNHRGYTRRTNLREGSVQWKRISEMKAAEGRSLFGDNGVSHFDI